MFFFIQFTRLIYYFARISYVIVRLENVSNSAIVKEKEFRIFLSSITMTVIP